MIASQSLQAAAAVAKHQISGGLVDAIKFEACLPGSAFAKLDVGLGQRVWIKAQTAARCDSRGWSCAGDPHPWTGPDGYGDANWPTAGTACVNAPIGMLVGAVSRYDVQGNMTLQQWTQIFGGNGFPVGGEWYFFTSPIKGFLYLLMNDGPGYVDNRGSIEVAVYKA